MNTTLSSPPMSLKLDVSVRDRLTRLAHSRKRTAHAIAREAVESFVTREEARDQFTADAVRSWEHYQETGLHVTQNEVTAWMDSWGTENELPPPTCHK